MQRSVIALTAAEDAVSRAARHGALWTVAVDALERARDAARQGDCADAIAEADKARAFADLGMRQLAYPPYRISFDRSNP